MSYLEPLPEGCPPDGAEEIVESRLVFRLVRYNPPSVCDFRSQRAEKPHARFNVSECIARGLSVRTKSDDAERLLKLPNLRGRYVCKVALDRGAGRIQQTGEPSHHTWWPFETYDILGNCLVV